MQNSTLLRKLTETLLARQENESAIFPDNQTSSNLIPGVLVATVKHFHLLGWHVVVVTSVAKGWAKSMALVLAGL